MVAIDPKTGEFGLMHVRNDMVEIHSNGKKVVGDVNWMNNLTESIRFWITLPNGRDFGPLMVANMTTISPARRVLGEIDHLRLLKELETHGQ